MRSGPRQGSTAWRRSWMPTTRRSRRGSMSTRTRANATGRTRRSRADWTRSACPGARSRATSRAVATAAIAATAAGGERSSRPCAPTSRTRSRQVPTSSRTARLVRSQPRREGSAGSTRRSRTVRSSPCARRSWCLRAARSGRPRCSCARVSAGPRWGARCISIRFPRCRPCTTTPYASGQACRSPS